MWLGVTAFLLLWAILQDVHMSVLRVSPANGSVPLLWLLCLCGSAYLFAIFSWKASQEMSAVRAPLSSFWHDISFCACTNCWDFDDTPPWCDTQNVSFPSPTLCRCPTFLHPIHLCTRDLSEEKALDNLVSRDWVSEPPSWIWWPVMSDLHGKSYYLSGMTLGYQNSKM